MFLHLYIAASLVLPLAQAFPQPHAGINPAALGDRATRVVGGEPAEAAEFPYLVALFLKSQTDVILCGGSLLDEKTVLTAAHCTYMLGPTPARYQVRAKTLTFAEGGQLVDVESIAIHPDFKYVGVPSVPNSDAAVWKLATPIEVDDGFVFATLPEKGTDPATNSTATVVGWGTTEYGGELSPVLRKVSIPIVARDECAARYEKLANVTETMVCGGFMGEGGKGSCHGDSGGPLLNEEGTVIGISSWTNKCSDPEYPGVFSNLGALVDFVIDNL